MLSTRRWPSPPPRPADMSRSLVVASRRVNRSAAASEPVAAVWRQFCRACVRNRLTLIEAFAISYALFITFVIFAGPAAVLLREVGR